MLKNRLLKLEASKKLSADSHDVFLITPVIGDAENGWFSVVPDAVRDHKGREWRRQSNELHDEFIERVQHEACPTGLFVIEGGPGDPIECFVNKSLRERGKQLVPPPRYMAKTGGWA